MRILFGKSRIGTAIPLTSPNESWNHHMNIFLSGPVKRQTLSPTTTKTFFFNRSCLKSAESLSKQIALFDRKTKSRLCE